MQMYSQVYKLGLKKAMEYRANFYMGLVSVVFPLTIQFFLWSGLFSTSETGIVFGYTFIQMLLYSVFAALVTKIIETDFVYEITIDIKEGGLAKYLVRPISYFRYNLMGYLGEKTGTIASASILIILIWGIGNIFYNGTIKPEQMLFFVMALIMGLVLNFIIFYAISSMGFWMIDASGAIFITTLIGTIVSGGIFPLDIFSDKIQFILHLLPFPYTSYFPVSILCGTIEGGAIVEGFILQIIWIIICGLITNILWKIGTRHYVSIGG